MTEKDSEPFRIFAMCLVKNEADIVADCLRSAAKWCHAIFVYDNGSEDGTWEAVRELANKLPCVVPFKQEAGSFYDSLRGEVFDQYRGLSRPGDWWCRLDADEFYIDDPRAFLADVPESFDVVWTAMFQYYLTERDAARYASDPHAFDDSVPAQQKCRYYRNHWTEPRFFRYHDRLTHTDFNWPYPLGPSFRKRIRVKHFQYRSPQQIEKRFATRRTPMSSGAFQHEMVPDWQERMNARRIPLLGWVADYIPTEWRERIVDSRTLIYDDGQSDYIIDERAMPAVRDLSPAAEP
jgi:hypothetical protein